jgi:hypothetical protein
MAGYGKEYLVHIIRLLELEHEQAVLPMYWFVTNDAMQVTLIVLWPAAVLQVSGYGNDMSSDGGDVWIIEWEGKGKLWKQDKKVRSYLPLSSSIPLSLRVRASLQLSNSRRVTSDALVTHQAVGREV